MRFKTEYTYTEKDGSIHKVTNLVDGKDNLNDVAEELLSKLSTSKLNSLTKLTVTALPTKLKLSKKVK